MQSMTRLESENDKLAVFYLAVLPAYRGGAFNLLSHFFEDKIIVFASEASIDGKVKTDFSIPNVRKVRMIRLKWIFIQIQGWKQALHAETLIVDLNPRSIAAWILILIRKIFRKRTLVWGHVSSRVRDPSKSSHLRRVMRRISTATIVYTYSEKLKAEKEISGSTIYVAPNSLYSKETIGRSGSLLRSHIIHSGRLVPEKKIDLVIRAFNSSNLASEGVKLIIIGDGPEKLNLQTLSAELGITSFVEFLGEVFDVDQLKKLYQAAFVSVSSGYVGLSLTQSLGFGVPMIISHEETHSPEIELYALQDEMYFKSDDQDSLSEQLRQCFESRELMSVQMETAARKVSELYCAEQMFEGLKRAILSEPSLKSLEFEKL